MRVLITTDVVGGVWSYTAELVDALARRGHELALVAFGGYRSRAQREWVAGRPSLEFTCVPCPLEWMPEPEPGLSDSVSSLQRLSARFLPDVIHLNQFYYGAHDLGAPKVVVAHSDIVTWWRVVKGADPPDDAWFRRYRGWVRAGLKGADLRVAPTAWLASRVSAAYETGPVQTVHNARSPGQFAPTVSDGVAGDRTAAARDAAAVCGAPGGGGPAPGGGPPARSDEAGKHRRRRRVVSAGRLWDEAKGARDLISAGRLLGDAAEIVVAGAVEHPGGGQDFPADAGGVRYVGKLAPADLAGIYTGAAVYAATSRYEPFGLAPLEAALAGCALVVSDIPTFRELWNGCALFYPPGDVEALAAALRRVLDTDDFRFELATAARERALERYTPDRMGREYEALYAEAVNDAVAASL